MLHDEPHSPPPPVLITAHSSRPARIHALTDRRRKRILNGTANAAWPGGQGRAEAYEKGESNGGDRSSRVYREPRRGDRGGAHDLGAKSRRARRLHGRGAGRSDPGRPGPTG